MAITSEIIGKLGGAEVGSFPVEGTVTGGSGSTMTLATMEVPEGETWLVAVVGTFTTARDSLAYYPEITIGSSRAAFRGKSGASGIVTGTVDIGIRRNFNLSSDSFTGHVYTVKM